MSRMPFCRGNRSFLALRLWAAVLVASATGLPAVVTAEERPFMARLEGNAHFISPPPLAENHETGEGEATHLGRFIWTSVEFVDFTVVPGGVSVKGSFVMTAADGDQLYGKYETIGYFDQFPPTMVTIHGTFEFHGGTGRFAEASGGGDLDAIASTLGDFPFEGTFIGTIDF